MLDPTPQSQAAVLMTSKDSEKDVLHHVVEGVTTVGLCVDFASEWREIPSRAWARGHVPDVSTARTVWSYLYGHIIDAFKAKILNGNSRDIV